MRQGMNSLADCRVGDQTGRTDSLPDRELYVAVHDEIYEGLFEEPIGQLLLRNNRVKLIVFQPQKEVILRWIA